MSMAPTKNAHTAHAALESTALFTPFKLGNLALKHRIVMAPLSRLRCDAESAGVNITGSRVAQYYGDRATDGGLQLSEATDIHPFASGYPRVPGISTPSQLQGWRIVTDAVHGRGGFIFAQLWHAGRAAVPSMLGGRTPLSSGTIPMTGRYLDGTECGDGPLKAMSVDEIKYTVGEWAAAAKRAVDGAGFDGVEIHSSDGYLLEQFLSDNINHRTDTYGGSIENRCRFTLDVVRAVCDAIGSERVGVRLSPYSYFQDARDSDRNTHWAYLCQQIAALPAKQRPIYVHMIEPRHDEVLNEREKLASLGDETRHDISLTQFRDILRPAGICFIACGNFTRDNVVAKLDADEADLVAFGRPFIANPDLVARFRNGWDLNLYDRKTFYGADPLEKGYNDYPFWGGAA